MTYGVSWDKKLNSWVVTWKSSGKLLGKYDTKEKAEKQKSSLILNNHPKKRK